VHRRQIVAQVVPLTRGVNVVVATATQVYALREVLIGLASTTHAAGYRSAAMTDKSGCQAPWDDLLLASWAEGTAGLPSARTQNRNPWRASHRRWADGRAYPVSS